MKNIIWIMTIVFSCGYSCVNAALSNVALGKPAYQIDTHTTATVAGEPSVIGEACKAVDGNTNGHYMSGYCSHTLSATNAWWEVDLGQIYRIDHVIVVNREDCCQDRLNDVQLHIGYGRGDYPVKMVHYGMIYSSYTFQLGPTVYGRWVKINRLTEYEALVLCEVQVFGEEFFREKIRFECVPGHIGTGSILQCTPANSRIHCCQLCLKTGGCSSVNYNPDERMCDQLEETNSTTNSNTTMQFCKVLN